MSTVVFGLIISGYAVIVILWTPIPFRLTSVELHAPNPVSLPPHTHILIGLCFSFSVYLTKPYKHKEHVALFQGTFL